MLIAERAPRLTRSPAWPLVRPLLYALLDYAKARAMADAIAELSGRDSLAYVSRLLALEVEVLFPERIRPPAGAWSSATTRPASPTGWRSMTG